MKRLSWVLFTMMSLSTLGTACGVGENATLSPEASYSTSISQAEFSGVTGQFSNVATLMMPWGGLCTATLISPTMVLTAAHCIYQDEHFPKQDFQSDAYSLVFTDPNGNTVSYESSDIHVMPGTNADNDIAIIELSSKIDIAPMPLMTEISTSALGNNVGLVGYGELKPGDVSSLGTQHIKATQVDAVSTHQIEYGSSQANTSCFGDSGGPVVHQRADGSYELAGVVHGGSAQCSGAAFASRADIHSAWILSVIGQ